MLQDGGTSYLSHFLSTPFAHDQYTINWLIIGYRGNITRLSVAFTLTTAALVQILADRLVIFWGIQWLIYIYIYYNCITVTYLIHRGRACIWCYVPFDWLRLWSLWHIHLIHIIYTLFVWYRRTSQVCWLSIYTSASGTSIITANQTSDSVWVCAHE